MPRTHILQSWVGAAEYDEGDSYNGQQIGNRNQKSVGVHILRSGDQWKANIIAYAAEQPKKKPVKKKSAFEQITLADRHYQRMENLALQLDAEYEEGSLSNEDYLYAMRQIEIRKEKAWIRLCKVRGWNPEQIDEEFEQEIFEESHKKHVDNAFIEGLCFTHSVIESLSKGNIFKKAFKKVLTVKQKLDKIITTAKQIIQE